MEYFELSKVMGCMLWDCELIHVLVHNHSSIATYLSIIVPTSNIIHYLYARLWSITMVHSLTIYIACNSHCVQRQSSLAQFNSHHACTVSHTCLYLLQNWLLWFRTNGLDKQGQLFASGYISLMVWQCYMFALRQNKPKTVLAELGFTILNISGRLFSDLKMVHEVRCLWM